PPRDRAAARVVLRGGCDLRARQEPAHEPRLGPRHELARWARAPVRECERLPGALSSRAHVARVRPERVDELHPRLPRTQGAARVTRNEIVEQHATRMAAGLREAMSRLPGGIVVVTTWISGRPWGLTVS